MCKYSNQKIRKEMKKAVSILRIAIITILGGFGTLFLFGEEQDEAILSFLLHFVLDKVFAIILLVVMFTLTARWKETDEWLKAIFKWCEEADNAPNPMQLKDNED